MSFFFFTYTPYTDAEWLTRLEQGSIFEKCWVKRSAVTLSRGLRGGQLYERGSGILTSSLSSQTLGSVSQRRQLYRTSNNSEGVTFIRLKFEMHLSHRKVTHCLSSRIPLSIYSLLLYCTARTTHVVIYTLSGEAFWIHRSTWSLKYHLSSKDLPATVKYQSMDSNLPTPWKKILRCFAYFLDIFPC